MKKIIFLIIFLFIAASTTSQAAPIIIEDNSNTIINLNGIEISYIMIGKNCNVTINITGYNNITDYGLLINEGSTVILQGIETLDITSKIGIVSKGKIIVNSGTILIDDIIISYNGIEVNGGFFLIY